MKAPNTKMNTEFVSTGNSHTSETNFLVSVVIPNMNRIDSLDEAIRSVLSQDYKNVENIIVDDSRSDIFETIRNKYRQQENIQVVRGDGKGDARARAKGVSISNGNLIAFLDSDDIWLPGKLSNHIRLWIQGKKIGFSWDIWQETGTGRSYEGGKFLGALSKFATVPGNKIFNYLWLVGNDIHMSSGIASRESIDAVGGFPLTNPCDWHLWMLLSTAFDGGFVDRVLTHKVISGTSRGSNKKIILGEYIETIRIRFITFRHLKLRSEFSYVEIVRHFLIISFYWLYILSR